jgi:hypothetical protein
MGLGPKRRIKLSFCPECGFPCDGCSHADGKDILPEEGDFSICISCATPLRFNADLSVRKMVPDDWLEAPKGFFEHLEIVKSIARRLEKIGHC